MCDLSAPEFYDEEKAREHLEAIRWPDGAVCVHCGGTERVYAIAPNKERKIRPGLYRCNDCDGSFTVTIGNVFERSKIPLNKWLAANHMLCASKKGCSAKQLERMLGVSYKTASFMAHRLREAMREINPKPVGEGSTVEVDETYRGNKGKQRKGARGYAHKDKIVSLVERGGKVRSHRVKAVNAKTLKPILKEQIASSAKVMTDEAAVYQHIGTDFLSHDSVTHRIGEYVRGDIHTNTIENFFSIFKRGMDGVYQHCGAQHLKRHLCEYDFRYNYREKLGYDDMARATMALRGIEGKRLTYRRPYCGI